MNYLFSPSELDYKAKKCQRCFYILKKYKINPGDKPPPVFSNFDVVQKNYFKNLNSKDLTDQLPDGKFMNKDNLPGLIISDILEDNDGRKFQLRGVPDIVIKFKNKNDRYEIIDFKNFWSLDFYFDAIHLNKRGTKNLANIIYENFIMK